jgi:hypothetical protein
LQADQLLRERSYSIDVGAGPTKVHSHVAALTEKRAFPSGSFSSYGMSTPMRRLRARRDRSRRPHEHADAPQGP